MSTETVETTTAVDEGLVDELPEGLGDVAVFELDFPENRVGAALAFAFVSAMGLVLAYFATPTPVNIAGWVFVVLGGVAAFRVLGGDR